MSCLKVYIYIYHSSCVNSFIAMLTVFDLAGPVSPLEILTTTSGLLTGSPYAVPQVGLVLGWLEVGFPTG